MVLKTLAGVCAISSLTGVQWTPTGIRGGRIKSSEAGRGVKRYLKAFWVQVLLNLD